MKKKHKKNFVTKCEFEVRFEELKRSIDELRNNMIDELNNNHVCDHEKYSIEQPIEEDLEKTEEKHYDDSFFLNLIDKKSSRKINDKKSLVICPYHAEKSPSMMIDMGKHEYYCFGCGNSGKFEDF